MTDEANKASDTTETAPQLNHKNAVKTMGGRQFWGDVEFFRGYRIQKNVLNQHYRLLDAKDQRHESGTLEACQQRLQELRHQQEQGPMSGKAVILIHGIGRSSKSFSGMATQLATDGYTVVSFEYPSTRIPIQESAVFLHSVIQSLDGITL